VPFFRQRLKQCRKGGAGLQAAQAWCVWRADVDGDVITQRREPAQQKYVIRRRFLQRGRFIFSNIDPQHQAFWTLTLDAAGKKFCAVVVEAHAVNHRPVFDQAEQARLWVAWLRSRCHRAQLDMPESQAS
jgi:hypothetical protein